MFKRFVRWLKLTFMAGKDHIWYVGYGSNIDEPRFLCYIRGGRPEGNLNEYPPARDTTLPSLNEGMMIDHELYFSKYSENWKGGVAFIKNGSSPNFQTYARRYLITKQQFEDLAKEDTKSPAPPAINFDQAVAQGNTIFKTPSWYGNVLYMGMNSGHAMFTLTNEVDLSEINKPSERYLKTISNGIKIVFKSDNNALIDYFISKQGVAGNYTRKELDKIFI
jgi:hypothetical protein